MAGTADELRKMAAYKRSPKNFTLIREMATALEQHATDASELLESLRSLREAVGDFQEELDESGDENPLTQDWLEDTREALVVFQADLPGSDDDSDSSVLDLIGELGDACATYEESLEDRDYSKADRDEMFDEVCNLLSAIADAMTPGKS